MTALGGVMNDFLPPEFGIPITVILALAWFVQGSATRRHRRRQRRTY